ncbi:MAG: hypothetical protein GXP62_07725 [Oligoflexia bacterium]|nr:hypothetical protein [Oligoflexia bacterium]
MHPLKLLSPPPPGPRPLRCLCGRVLAIGALAGLLMVGSAQASSRMVVQVDGVFAVVLDSVPVTSLGSMGRTILSSVTPGQHSLQVRDPTGKVVYQATIDVPDNASVSASWDGQQMSLVGAHEVTALTAQDDGAFRDPADVPVQQPNPALDAANDKDRNNQLASSNGQAPVNDTHAVGGRIPYEVGQVANTVAAAAISMPSLAVDPVLSTIGSGLAYTLSTAEAGGIRKHYQPSLRQGNPNTPPPVLEDLKLINVGGKPLSVFVDGMWLDDFAEGQTEKTFKIEVGRRELQFVDPARNAVVFQGSLRVKKDYVITLECSPTQQPRATNASWAWAPL